MSILTAINPFVLLFLPSVLIVFSTMGLMQFGQFFQVMVMYSKKSGSSTVWRSYIQPGMKSLVNLMETALGPADKFKPGLTHVLLVSLIFVVAASALHIHKAIVQAARDIRSKTS